MGPIALFDKSFLQSLSVDDSVFFDNFFFPAICPLFFVETLADLEKAVRQGRTPEQEVGIIAMKVPEMSGGPVAHHSRLALRNMLGDRVSMDGRIPVEGGAAVKFEGKPGVVFDVSPEAEAFSRWQKGEFLAVERTYARAWRQDLASTDLMAVAAGMRSMGVDPQTCRSLEEAKQMTAAFLRRGDVINQIKLAFVFIGAPPQYESLAIEKWRATGSLPFTEYAPYASYVLAIEVFFQIAIGANLISTARASNRTDIASFRVLLVINCTFCACAFSTWCPNSVNSRLTQGECVPVSRAMRLRGIFSNVLSLAKTLTGRRISSLRQCVRP